MKDAQRALQRLDGVRDIEADIGGMTVKIKPASDRTLDLTALRPALASEGVRLRKLLILADGAVESSADGARFRIAGWPDAYALEGKAPTAGEYRARAAVRIRDSKPVLRIESSKGLAP